VFRGKDDPKGFKRGRNLKPGQGPVLPAAKEAPKPRMTDLQLRLRIAPEAASKDRQTSSMRTISSSCSPTSLTSSM
jgi:hypothetical protein